MGAKSTRNTTQNNRSDGHLLEYFRKSFIRGGGAANAVPPSGLTATGGVISDYTDGSSVYRAHIFSSSGTFTVSAPGTYGDTVECLVVAGGGGGAGYGGGGGGGAVIRVQAFPRSVGSYSIVVAAGGAGRISGSPTQPSNEGGTSTAFGYSATGGGAAGGYNDVPATAGANGGGHGAYLGPPGTPQGVLGVAPTIPAPLSPYATVYAGNRGGTFGSSNGPWGDYPSGGGAGAGGDGGTVLRGSVGGAGGNGQVVNIIPSPPSVNSGNGYIWGGGGGGSIYDTSGTGGVGGPGGGGGGADGPSPGGSGGLNDGGPGGPGGSYVGGNGGSSTGGGGGGSSYGSSGTYAGGNGGSGIVVVRYQIASLTATAKATGGAISFYSGKTIHTFTSTGTFTAPSPLNPSPLTVEYVVIGGGSSGGACAASQGGGAGGGGAGGYLTGPTTVTSGSSVAVTIGAGGASPKTPGNNHGTVGTPSSFGAPLTAPTGGYGAMADASPKTGGGAGASGGGGGGGGGAGTNANPGPATGAPFPGTIGATPSAGWGHAGGAGVTAGQGYSGGGGGGAGGAGVSGTYGTNGKGGNGGLSIQLPATFRNPASAPGPVGGGLGFPGPTTAYTNGDTSGLYWFAGGGGGGINPLGGGTPVTGYGGVGPGSTTNPFAGAGNAGKNGPGSNAIENSGSGGGGSGGDDAGYSGSGGSGIVLIAYPS